MTELELWLPEVSAQRLALDRILGDWAHRDSIHRFAALLRIRFNDVRLDPILKHILALYKERGGDATARQLISKLISSYTATAPRHWLTQYVRAGEVRGPICSDHLNPL